MRKATEKRYDRPLARSIIKLGSRLFLGSKRAHWQDSFPGLNLATSGGRRQVFYRHQVVCTLEPHSIIDIGKPATYVVGSGPSINDCDLRRVEARCALLLNGAINLMAREIPEPLAVAIEDERFVWRHFSLMRNRIPAGTICLFSVQVLRAICENDPCWLSDKRIVLIDNIVKPYGLPRRKPDELAEMPFAVFDRRTASGLSQEPDRGVFQGGSVAISALQFLIASRPNLIGFFGVDISNANSPRFYETEGQAAYSGIASAQERLLRHFELGLSLCAQQGINLECYSSSSALLTVGYQYSDRFSLSRQAR